MRSCLLILCVSSLLFCQALAFCPLPKPIVNSQFVAQTRVLTTLPRDRLTGSASIICIKSFPKSRDLAVCTLTKIYRVRQDGSFTVFLDVEDSFRRATGRRLNYENKQHGGLRSVAFHPGFAGNGLFYISAMENRPSNPGSFKYISNPTKRKPIKADSVLVEYRVKKGKADPFSYRLLFRVGMPVNDHPIKQIEFFGRLLYIAHGDGSEQSATFGGGQNNDALGKILRINPLRRGSKPYTIPSQNIFPTRSKKLPPEVFAYGFRNPHHICFSRSGRLFVADAGRDNREEINLVSNGRNYGWSLREGTCEHKKSGGIQNGVEPLPRQDGFVYPVAEFAHMGRTGQGFIGVAVAGGCPIENGSRMSGKYWYSDFPKSGDLYFSNLRDIYRARTSGPSRQLTKATTFRAKIRFNGRVYPNLHAVMASESRYRNTDRVDVRFGRGSRGELYWSSKRNGKVYVFTSSQR